MVHTHQPEIGIFALYKRTVYPSSPADRTIGDQDRLSAHRIPYLVMITDYFDGIGPGCPVIADTDDQAVIVAAVRSELLYPDLVEHFIGEEPEIEQIEDPAIDQQNQDQRYLLPDLSQAQIKQQRPNDQGQPDDPQPNDIPVQEISQADRIVSLAAGEGHDKINTQDLEGEKKDQPDP